MKYGRAFAFGVLGSLVMTVMGVAGRAMGMPANIEMMLGTMFGLPAGTTAWLLGFGIHLLNGGIFGLIDGCGFEYLTRRADWLVGVGFGLVHALPAGVFMGFVPAIHPMIPEQMPAPGWFMAGMGMMGIVAEFVMHAIFGAIVGAGYGRIATRSYSIIPGTRTGGSARTTTARTALAGRRPATRPGSAT